MVDNPFDILDVPARFDLDERQLHEKFIRASAATHPDRFTDPFEQAQAADRASRINEAYHMLSDPERRARALLDCLAGDAQRPTAQSGAEDDPARGADSGGPLPPNLLMEMMEVRERMEEAIAENDAAELDRLRQWAHQQRRERLDTVGQLFIQQGDENDARPGDSLSPELARRIRVELNALRYFQRMLDQMP